MSAPWPAGDSTIRVNSPLPATCKPSNCPSLPKNNVWPAHRWPFDRTPPKTINIVRFIRQPPHAFAMALLAAVWYFRTTKMAHRNSICEAWPAAAHPSMAFVIAIFMHCSLITYSLPNISRTMAVAGSLVGCYCAFSTRQSHDTIHTSTMYGKVEVDDLLVAVCALSRSNPAPSL